MLVATGEKKTAAHLLAISDFVLQFFLFFLQPFSLLFFLLLLALLLLLPLDLLCLLRLSQLLLF